MSAAASPQLSLPAYETALYRFMAQAAITWGGTNAQYGAMIAAGAPATMVNDLCPFDTVGLSRELAAHLIIPPDFRGAARRQWIKRMRHLATATKVLQKYLSGAPIGILIERDGMSKALHFDEVLSVWEGMEKADLRCVREVARALALVMAVCDVLIATPEIFLVTDWVDPFYGAQGERAQATFSDPVTDARLLAGFNIALADFFAAAAPIFGLSISDA